MRVNGEEEGGGACGGRCRGKGALLVGFGSEGADLASTVGEDSRRRRKWAVGQGSTMFGRE